MRKSAKVTLKKAVDIESVTNPFGFPRDSVVKNSPDNTGDTGNFGQ